MAQIFHPATNTVSKVSVFLGGFVVAGLAWLSAVWYRSSYVSGVHVVRDQPVPFSHQHHVGGLGIDCRFCHTAVEDSAFAGLPPVKTCMHCHSQIWADSPMLEPVRAAFRDGRPIAWTRVHALADFAFFDHSIHVAHGVGCATCHGRVDRMPLMWKEQTLFMEWCLECHRNPAPHLRPREEVFNMAWEPTGKAHAHGHLAAPTHCSACHR